MKIDISKHTLLLQEKVTRIDYYYEYKRSGSYRYALKISNGTIKDIEDGPQSRNQQILTPRAFFSILRFHPEEYDRFVRTYLWY